MRLLPPVVALFLTVLAQPPSSVQATGDGENGPIANHRDDDKKAITDNILAVLSQLKGNDAVLDAIAELVADRIADRVAEKLDLLQDEDKSTDMNEDEDESLVEFPTHCPQSLEHVIEGAIENGGNCDTLYHWSECRQTLLDYVAVSDYPELGCDHPDIFEHGMTSFCESKRVISDYFDIKCDHHKAYRDFRPLDEL